MTPGNGCPVSVIPDLPDLFDDAFISAPREHLSWLQAHAPVHYDAARDLWLISRHADIRTVLGDPVTFAPDNALDAVVPMRAASLRVLASAGFSLPHTLANNGGASHPMYRRTVAAFFSPSRVADAEGMIRDLVEDATASIATALESGGPVDLVTLLARDLPPRVLMALLGLDDVPLPTLKRWSSAALELFWGNPDRDRQLDLARESAEFYDWLRAQIRTGGSGRDTIVGALAALRDGDGDPISEADAIAICFFVLVAGQETTSQLLAVTIHRLLGERAVWRRLAHSTPAERERLARDCVEEVLRLDSPVTTWRRVTRSPVRISGMDVPASASLLLMLTASGSDPAHVTDPDLFAPGRARGADHHAFGYGRHFCVGAGLARAEARIVAEVLSRELPGLRLAESSPPQLGLLSFRAPTRVLAVSSR